MQINNNWNFGALARMGLGTARKPATQAAKTGIGGLAGLASVSASSSRTMAKFKNDLARLTKSIDLIPECHIFDGPQTDNWATASVRLSSTGSQFDRFDPISMQVHQTATGQLNHGFALDKTGSDYAAGTHSFELETADGAVHRFDVTVQAGDTNYAVQQKMAQAMNSRDIGVQVEMLEHEGTNTLRFVSAKTGDDAVTFTLRDAQGSSLMYSSGTEFATSGPQNAKYTLNGKEYESTTNTVDVGGCITAELIGHSNGKEFSITDGYNETYANNVISIIAHDLSVLMETAKSVKEETGLDTLELEMQLVLNQYATAMGDFGVVINNEGYLDFDMAKLGSANQNGSVRDFFEGYLKNGGGIFDALREWATGLSPAASGGLMNQSV